MAAIEDALYAIVEDDAAALRSALECLMVAIRDINVSMDRMFGMWFTISGTFPRVRRSALHMLPFMLWVLFYPSVGGYRLLT
jgi:hypothetical protein